MADTPEQDATSRPELVAPENPEESPEESRESSDDEILEEARARLALTEEAESEIRKLALEDLEFISGKQWPDNIQQERERDGRPCLVINRLPQFVQQVTNDQRQNRPAIKVHPVDDGADVETAKVMQGLIRHIEYNSNADVAYDTAFESASRTGLGYWRVLTDFVDPGSFDQEIYIKRIRNTASVFFDPYAQEPDGSDANWAFIVDDLSPEEYKSKYPDSQIVTSGMDLAAIGNNVPGWVKNDSVRVAEYFYKEMQDSAIHLLSTGETVKDEDLEQHLASAAQAGVKTEVVRSRPTKIPVIKWCKINGTEILEKTEWPGIYIPVIPVYGAELFINGKRILESVIRHAKDPQRMYNYWKSAETEAIALAPRAPFIAADGQLEGYENQWETANRRNHAYLYYKAISVGGQPLPPPQRNAVEPAVQAITQAAMATAEDMKSTTGVYDAGVGAAGPEVSGVAIQRRSNQIQTSTFHFVDNLTRSLRHTGRVLIDLMPHIYDTARAARIVKEDGTQKIVKINQKTVDDDGKEVIYALDSGKYDAIVDTGPSFASKRQEASAFMQEMVRAYPPTMQVAGDLVVKNLDVPGAQELSERFKKTLPPQLQDAPNMKDVPPQVQAQLQHMDQLIQQLTGHLNETTKIIETKKLELEHRERIEILKLQTDAEIQMAKLGSQESIALLQAKFEEMEHRLAFLKVNEPIAAPDNFDPQQADGGNYAGLGHVGGTENITGGESPGQPMKETP